MNQPCDAFQEFANSEALMTSVTEIMAKSQRIIRQCSVLGNNYVRLNDIPNYIVYANLPNHLVNAMVVNPETGTVFEDKGIGNDGAHHYQRLGWLDYTTKEFVAWNSVLLNFDAPADDLRII
jgi:hypothetical protein